MIRILAHAHSTWSHDGHIGLSAYVDVARRAGCRVVLLSEHEESGWNASRYDAYVRACHACSLDGSSSWTTPTWTAPNGTDPMWAPPIASRPMWTTAVQLVPGIEFLQDGCHVLCYGLRQWPRRPSTAAALADAVHQQGCLLTLAHPGKYRWQIPPALLDAVDAIEIWNSKWIYDGAAGPHPDTIRLARLKPVLVGQDVHKPKHISPLILRTMGEDVLDDLVNGRYDVSWETCRWDPDALRRPLARRPDHDSGFGRERPPAGPYARVSRAGHAARPRTAGPAASEPQQASDACRRARAPWALRPRLYRVGIDAILAGYRAAGRLMRGEVRQAPGRDGRTRRLVACRPTLSLTPLPFVSVILPVRQEQAYIGRALASVLAQEYPADRFEILVADGQSTDGTREMVQAYASREPGRLRLIDNPGRIVPTGLNAAIAAARGDVIVRVDGHCEVPPDFVRRAVTHLSRDAVDCVGGILETIGETPMARVIAAAMSARFGVGGSAFRAGASLSTLTDTVAFPAFTREILARVGPFDEELVRNQDDEYSYRLRRLGGRILLATDMRARYYSRGTLRSLWRQCFGYGYWKVRVLQKHPRQMRARQFVPALFVASLAGSTILAIPLMPLTSSALPLAAPIVIAGAYVIAACAASWETCARLARQQARPDRWPRKHGRDPAILLRLPVAFAAMHGAYGAGSLWGAWAFRRRWRAAAATPAVEAAWLAAPDPPAEARAFAARRHGAGRRVT